MELIRKFARENCGFLEPNKDFRIEILDVDEFDYSCNSRITYQST